MKPAKKSEQSGESVTDRLREDILLGALAPGTRLIELQLTERYDVGRAAIRAAILELDKEGLVRREANRGATVRSLSIDEAIEVYEARAALEGLLARHAAKQASEDDRTHLRNLVPSMRAAIASGDVARFANLGRELHEQVRRISRHAVASDLAEILRNQSRHYPERISAVREHAEQSLAEHAAIVAAIAEGDERGAQAAVQSHIDSIIATLRSSTS